MSAKKRSKRRTIPALLAALAAFAAGDAAAAVKCQLRLGRGCNGPVVYEIQLCARVTFEQGRCLDLCRDVRPICQVSDYDQWVSAYDKKGRRGYHGELAETNKPDAYDQSGQLAATAGNTYTVCARTAGAVGSYSDPFPMSAAASCPAIKVATAESCGAGTVFNGDPTNPKCVTRDSYCSGGGSTGNFVATMSAGFQMVAVQNQHFVNAPGQDANLQLGAAVAGTDALGLVAPIKASVSADTRAGSFESSNPTRRGFPAGSGGGAGAPALPDSGEGASTASAASGEDSAFASKNFAMEKSVYGAGGSVGAGAGPGGGADSGGGGWFSGGAGGAATAGGSSGDVGFDGADGEGGGASRGIASDGRLIVEDPENYFLMSDVEVSLFKRVTAQCRKKERSLVLAPMAGGAPLRSAK